MVARRWIALLTAGPRSVDDRWPLLQRVRWRFVLLNLVGVALVPFSFPYVKQTPGAVPTLYAAAVTGLAVWTIGLYRSAGRPVAVRMLGPALAGVIGISSGHHSFAFGTVFMGLFLLSLYGTRGQVLRSAGAFYLAYELAVWATGGAEELLNNQLLSMLLAIVVMALVMAEMAATLRRSDDAGRREQGLAAAGRRLLRARDSTAVAQVAVDGAVAMLTEGGVAVGQVSLWRQERDGLALAASHGDAATTDRVPFQAVSLDLLSEYRSTDPVRLSPEMMVQLQRRLGLPVEPLHGLAVPLTDGEEAIGTLFVRTTARVPDELATALQRFADEVSLADRAARRNQLLAGVLANSADGIVLFDNGGRLVFISPAVVELVGHDIPVGAPLGDLLRIDHDRRPVADLDDVERNAAGLVIQQADGTALEVEVAARAIPGEGTVLNIRDVSRQRRLQEEVNYRAFNDLVTGLPNRTRFLDRLEDALASARRSGGRIAVALLDLDDFKAINDARGHLFGDQVLRHVADRVGGRVRTADTFARLGGDEFALLLEGLDEHADVRAVLEGVLGVMGEAIDLDGYRTRISASCGVTVSSGEHSAEDMLGDADIAMYAAKDRGKNGIVFFDSALRECIEERRVLRDDLEMGIARDELRLHYQPVLALPTRDAVGVEALVRWQHPTRGLLAPPNLIPLPEDSGLVSALGSWVVLTALRDLAEWMASGAVAAHFQMHVNLSAHQLAEPELVADIRTALQVFGVHPSQLVLEITETALTANPDLAEQILRQLRGIGVGIAIDDFGTGYASFTYLRRFPVGIVKIDRSFVTDVEKGPEEAALARAIVRLAQSLGMTTVAEGIETEASRELLDSWGCDQGQGWLWSRALPAGELLTWLERGAAVPRVDAAAS